MNISGACRDRFAELCTLILPAWQHMPDAGSLGLEHQYLDVVLNARPDLAAVLERVLSGFEGPVREDDLDTLNQTTPLDLQQLLTAVCGAYYLHPEVRDALGYSGQQALGLSKGGFGAEDLVLKIMDQPGRFRSDRVDGSNH